MMNNQITIETLSSRLRQYISDFSWVRVRVRVRVRVSVSVSVTILSAGQRHRVSCIRPGNNGFKKL